MMSRPFLAFVLMLGTVGAIQAEDAPLISGVHELAIGTTDPIPLIEYFQQFGYRVGRSGDLDAEDVNVTPDR